MVRMLLVVFLMLLATAAVEDERGSVGLCLLEVRDGPFQMRCTGTCGVTGDCPNVPYQDTTTWAPTVLNFCNCEGGETIWCSGGVPSAVPCQTFVADYGNGILIAACMDCGCGAAFPEPPGSGACKRRTEPSEEWHTMCDCPQ